MLRLPPFRYEAPTTVEEAVQIMAEHGPQAMVVAGGTDLYPKMKRRQMEPRVVVGMARIPGLSAVEGDAASGVSLGARLTLTKLEFDDALAAHYPAIPEAAATISTPPLRNAGTLGGNLCVDTRCTYYDQTLQWRRSIDFCMKKDGSTCWVAPGSPRCLAVSSTDLAPVMIALGAEFDLVGPKGARSVSAFDFYNDDGITFTTKKPGEIMTAVRLGPAAGWRSTYRKLRRREAFDFPILGAAVAVKTSAGSGNGRPGEVEDVRVALGGVASRPLELDLREALVGKEPTVERIKEAARAAFRPAKALDNTDLMPLYRKRLAPIFVERGLRRLLLGEDV